LRKVFYRHGWYTDGWSGWGIFLLIFLPTFDRPARRYLLIRLPNPKKHLNNTRLPTC
jgi:hypothetical protein